MKIAPMQRDDVMSSWYLASLVRRYHTWPTVNVETVGQHSHGVAMIWCRLYGKPSGTDGHVLRHILEHDLAELWTGDAPFPAKARYPMMKAAHAHVETDANAALGVDTWGEFHPDTLARIKVCDLLQMYLFGLHELRMGNTYALPIVRDMLTAAISTAPTKADIDLIRKFAEENHE
jgi:5'-deoxynucleotidase YfbR-like HD superfamily hydrolase